MPTRQRTMAPTPEDYDPDTEHSVGIPTTIHVPCDALSVGEGPRIPIKIECLKLRAPSTRHGRTIKVNINSVKEDGDGTSSSGDNGSVPSIDNKYDEFLYGTGTGSLAFSHEIKLKTAQEEQQELKQANRELKEQPTHNHPHKKNLNPIKAEKEEEVLAELGRSLVNKAREASKHKRTSFVSTNTANTANKKGPPTTRGRMTHRENTNTFQRSNSVPSIASISAREVVDGILPKRSSISNNIHQTYNHNYNQKEIDLSVCSSTHNHSHSQKHSQNHSTGNLLDAQSDALSHSHASLQSSTMHTNTSVHSLSMHNQNITQNRRSSILTQPSMTMIFNNNNNKKQLSTRTMQTQANTHSTSTASVTNNMSISELGNSSYASMGGNHTGTGTDTATGTGHLRLQPDHNVPLTTETTNACTTTSTHTRSKPRRAKSLSVGLFGKDIHNANTNTNTNTTSLCSLGDDSIPGKSTSSRGNNNNDKETQKKKRWLPFRRSSVGMGIAISTSKK